MIGTFFLMWVILMIGKNTSTRPNNDVYGIAIGGTVGMCVIAWGNISGACLNPHRFFGPAMIAGDLWESSYDYWWIYIVGPYTGGALAGLVYYYSFIDWNGTEEKAITADPKFKPQFSFKKEESAEQIYKNVDAQNKKVLCTIQEEMIDIKETVNKQKSSSYDNSRKNSNVKSNEFNCDFNNVD